mgnify:CR=1 FL=1
MFHGARNRDLLAHSLAKADDFMMAFQRITTEWCWGYAWNRPGLDRKTRSMLNLAMLTALNRAPEIKLLVLAALVAVLLWLCTVNGRSAAKFAGFGILFGLSGAAICVAVYGVENPVAMI